MLPLFDVTNTSRGVLLFPHFNCAVALITTVGFGIKMGRGNGNQLQVAGLKDWDTDQEDVYVHFVEG